MASHQRPGLDAKDKQVSSSVLDRIKNLTEKTEGIAMTINNNSFQRLTQQEFKLKDRDNDGVLSAKEFGDQDEFAKFDKNHNGKMTLDELKKGRDARRKGAASDFKQLDKNKDGLLSRSELDVMFNKLGYSDAQADDTFKRIDENGDAGVSKDELAYAAQFGRAKSQIQKAAPEEQQAQRQDSSLSTLLSHFNFQLSMLKGDMTIRKEGLSRLVSEVTQTMLQSPAPKADKIRMLDQMIAALPTNNWDYDGPREALRSLKYTL